MKIDATTKICAIIGNPVGHSLSPAMHNSGYKHLGINFAYLAFPVENVKNAVEGIKALNIKGVSVTVPHKLEVMKYLDSIDKKAKDIGAVNTIVNNNGKLEGFNTDCEGAVRALKEVTNLKNKRIIIVGAGGAARAIAFGLKQEKASILVVNRTPEKAAEPAKETGAEYGDLKSLKKLLESDILIHTTPTGMHPNINGSIIPVEYLHNNLTVFDIVYNPKETILIKNAKKQKCKIVFGYKMLLYQAIAQFEMFTGQKAPVRVMEKALLDQLGGLKK